MADTAKILEPIRARYPVNGGVAYLCPICNRVWPNPGGARWCCQEPDDNAPPWETVTQDAGVER